MANEFVLRKGLISLGGVTVPITGVTSGYTVTENDFTVEATTGSFTISGLYTDLLVGTAYSVKGDVIDGNAALLTQIDALNAKIVALNALIAKIMKKLGVK